MKTFRKRLSIGKEACSVEVMQVAFAEFGDWLLGKVGSRKASLTINRYLTFFLKIEKEWKVLPKYPALLKHFEAEGLRRFRLPVQWLCEAKALVIDPQAREEASERRRIAQMIATISSGSPAARILEAYSAVLHERLLSGKTSVRSVRLALRSSVSLLLATDPTGQKLPDQESIERYLVATPGQRNSVFGFIRLLSDKSGTCLVTKMNAKTTKSVKKKRLEGELLKMMSVEGVCIKKRWVPLALAYFHNIPMHVGRVVKQECVAEDPNGGLLVTIDHQVYWIPMRIETPPSRRTSEIKTDTTQC